MKMMTSCLSDKGLVSFYAHGADEEEGEEKEKVKVKKEKEKKKQGGGGDRKWRRGSLNLESRNKRRKEK